jgi:hypothetical protein
MGLNEGKSQLVIQPCAMPSSEDPVIGCEGRCVNVVATPLRARVKTSQPLCHLPGDRRRRG